MTKNTPVVETQMLVRRPAHEVFNAFIDPAITTNFWFTKSSGRLEPGKKIIWEWEMYNVNIDVSVTSIETDRKIMLLWGRPETTIEFNFEATSERTTYVTIKNYGFHQTGDELIKVIIDVTGGFTTVLDGLKAYMEQGIRLNLIGDKFSKK